MERQVLFEKLRSQLSFKLVDWSIDPVKAPVIVTLAMDIVVNGLRAHVAVFSMQHLVELFGRGEPLERSQIANRMISDYKSDLVQLGDLRAKQAEDVSAFVIPYLLLLISNYVSTNPAELKTLLDKNGKGLFSKIKFWNSASRG